MTLSHDPVRHYIQWHSTKSTDRNYLLPYSWRLTFLVHQTSFIYCWEAATYIALLRSLPAAILFVGKRSLYHLTTVSISTHQHPICWDATFFHLFPLGFGSPLIALQLQADDAFINLFPAKLVACSVAKKCPRSTQSSSPMEPPCGWWEYGLLDGTSTTLWWMNCPGCRNAIAGEVGCSDATWGLGHRVASKRLSERGIVQIVGTDSRIRGLSELCFCQGWKKSKRHAA